MSDAFDLIAGAVIRHTTYEVLSIGGPLAGAVLGVAAIAWYVVREVRRG